MEWTTTKPTKPGWYWFRNTAYREEVEPRIVEVRWYGKELFTRRSGAAN